MQAIAIKYTSMHPRALKCIQMHTNTYECAPKMHSNAFKCIQMHSNAHKRIQMHRMRPQMHSNAFKCIQMHSDAFNLPNASKCKHLQSNACQCTQMHSNAYKCIQRMHSWAWLRRNAADFAELARLTHMHAHASECKE